MKVSDVTKGSATTLEIMPAGSGAFDRHIQPLTESRVFRSEYSDSATLAVKDGAWEVCGADTRNQELLDLVFARGLPQLAWVALSIPRGDPNPRRLVVEVREFPSGFLWPDDAQFGVTDKTVDAVRRKRKSLKSIDDVVGWLSDKVFLDGTDGKRRLILSGGSSPQALQRGGFQLYGKGIVVDVAFDDERKMVIKMVSWGRRDHHSEDRRPAFLVSGDFKFVDHTVAGQFRDTARSLIDQINRGSGGYLKLWKEYNALERESILRRARDFGWLSYSSCRPQADGSWQFRLIEDAELLARYRVLAEGETVDLEAAERLPDEFVGSSEDEASDQGERTRDRVFSGECVGIDRRQRAVTIKPPSGREEDDITPPKRGVLFVSLSGDRTRLARREEAQSAIATASCPMLQLGVLIEGHDVPVRHHGNDKALSTAAKDVFGGEPTDSQRAALYAALNTPDIALIQGPPGTGKTRTIAALQTRLSELDRDSDSIAGNALLSSYQHDAVENVANATRVYGLPATKIGRRRGETEEADGVETWRVDCVEKVSALLKDVDETPATVALKRCRDLTIGYLNAPTASEDVPKLLDDVRGLAGSHVPPALGDQLLELSDRFRQRVQGADVPDDSVDLGLKAVRGLRTDAVGFLDDGSIQAHKAMRRLDALDVLSDEERELLENASEWEGEETPSFLAKLAELQKALIDRLLPDERPAGAPRVSEDVELVLKAVLDALRERNRSTRGGVEAVLYEYRDDLDNDQRGVREAVERYTAVLAATCQQALGYQMRLQKSDNVEFDTVVVDEAARANPLDLFIPMSLARRRIVLVGDHRQLPHMLEQEVERELEKNVSEKTKEMLERSLFYRLFREMRAREDKDGFKRTVTLDKQYRMHPVLGDFVSDIFYPRSEAFESPRKPEEFVHGIEHYGEAVAAWVDIPFARGGESRGRSKSRTAEAKWVANEAHRILTARTDFSVGVITFYSAQVDELMRQMLSLGLTQQAEDGTYNVADEWRTTRDEKGRLKERLRVGTVDAFQGKEFDVVLLSVTRSNDIDADDVQTLRRKYGHLMLENRLCVAMSRQQRLLIAVGDSAMLRPAIAAKVVPGLVRFYELCGGEHGVRL
ncbi:MAG: AAA domain-containing protein [Armatimonadota bacterium]